MRSDLSRRGFLVGLGGGAASAALVWGLGRSPYWMPPAAEAHPVTPCCEIVTPSGWLLTTDDRDQLTRTGQMTIVEGTSYQGGDIANDVVENVEACEAWCASNLDCRSFTFAGPTHPQEDMRNRCWIKNARDLPTVSDAVHVSGFR